MFRKRNIGPELSAPTLEYMAQSYISMLDWIEGKCDPPFNTMGLDIPDMPISQEDLSSQTKTNAALGACLVLDACITGLHMARNESQPDSLELDRRSKLGELMVKGSQYYKINIRRGERKLRQPDSPYSPKLVAVVVSYGVHETMKFTKDSQFNEFTARFIPLQ